MQGKHELPFVCLWKSGTLSPLNKMFSCTLHTSSTKIVLLTSNPTPEQQVSIQLTLAVPGPPPDSISSTQACDTTIDIHITEEMWPCFLHFVNRRAKQLVLKGLITILLNRLNTVDLGPFRLLQPLV